MGELVLQTDSLEERKLREALPNALVKAKVHKGELYLCVRREQIREVAALLKNDPELEYRFFSECLGVDYSRWEHERDLEGRFEVVYNLLSLKLNRRVFVKVAVDDGQKVPSLVPVYAGAEYPEREIWDLFGIVFEGNEQTQRFLMPDDWVGHPLRKEYPLGGEDVLFAGGERGPAVEDIAMPHAGEGFEGKTGTEEVSGR
ncbi:MAG: NADH-quinone oxidoreductase subunit C [Armatimonadetes bacterium]|nr:NADH-quinone oxidoreductase subunit C [Armatimonadota bacterium]MCA1996599.1 NADH-quinone oxidoreductase subunit C [Armatimonadota bacterium]